MNCTEIDESLTEIARGKDASPALWRQALLHARSCSRCGVRLDGEQALNDLLDELRGEMRLESAPSAVETALLAEFRRRQEPVLPIPDALPLRSYLSRWLVAAAVILLVFAVGVLALRFSHSESGTTPAAGDNLADTKPKVSVPETAQAPNRDNDDRRVAIEGVKPRGGDKRLRHAHDRVSRYVSANKGEPAVGEVVTEFFPISGKVDLSDVDSGQVLRVRLPRRALMAFGLPVDPNLEDQRVTADVLLTSDGVARAIRFVR